MKNPSYHMGYAKIFSNQTLKRRRRVSCEPMDDTMKRCELSICFQKTIKRHVSRVGRLRASIGAQCFLRFIKNKNSKRPFANPAF